MRAVAGRLLIATLVLGVFIRAVIGLELNEDSLISGADLGLAFLVGLYHDLWAFLLIASPVALTLLIFPKAVRVVMFVVCVAMLIIAFAEVFFWWEFASRLNRLVFHYLLFPREVIVFLEDQFYVSIFALPTLAVAYALYRAVRGKGAPLQRGSSKALLGALGLTVVGSLWVEPWAFSDSRRINQMASNGYLGVLHAARTDESRWHGRYWQPAQEIADAGPLPGARGPRVSGIQHVVLIVEESFGGPVWREPLQRQRYLPEFSRLMAEGVYFDRLYATGSRTTRGLEALLNGYPPLPGIAVTQRAGFEQLPSLARALGNAGFHSIFVYGGWPNFSNFRAYWQAAGYVEQTSRDDFADSSFATSWGVADEELFARVSTEMRRLTAVHDRVFLTTLTVSHHRPFDFPEGRVTFSASQRRSEFALAYADWALGDFLEQSRRESWFADTLFVVVADHGPKIVGDGPIPIDGFRIPMVFYSPQNIAPQEVGHLGSSMSLGVTLLNLLGIDNAEGLYGTDLLAEPHGVVPVEHDYHVGLVTDSGLTVLHRNGKITSWRHGSGRLSETAADVVVGARVSRLFGNAHDHFYSELAPQ